MSEKCCQALGCDGAYYCSGYCKVHYNKWYRENHVEYFQQKSKEHYGKNPDYYAAAYQARRQDPETVSHDRSVAAKRGKETYLERRYGITQEQLEEMNVAQSGKCKICRKEESGRVERGRLYIDHCHITGKVRGLLCHQCNAGLGMFKDNLESLAAAIEYLKGSK